MAETSPTSTSNNSHPVRRQVGTRTPTERNRTPSPPTEHNENPTPPTERNENPSPPTEQNQNHSPHHHHRQVNEEQGPGESESTVLIRLTVNFRTLWVFAKMPRLIERSRMELLGLICHLWVVGTALVAITLKDTWIHTNAHALVDHVRPFQLDASRRHCGILKFWEAVLYGVFGWNVVAIFYECLELSNFLAWDGNGLGTPAMMSVWLMSAVVNFPHLLMWETSRISGVCEPHHIFGKVWITMGYQLARFFMTYVIPTAILIYFKWRIMRRITSTKYGFCNQTPEELSERMYNVNKFLYGFIGIWFLLGLDKIFQIFKNIALMFAGKEDMEPSYSGQRVIRIMVTLYLYITVWLLYRQAQHLDGVLCLRMKRATYPLEDEDDDDEEDSDEEDDDFILDDEYLSADLEDEVFQAAEVENECVDIPSEEEEEEEDGDSESFISALNIYQEDWINGLVPPPPPPPYEASFRNRWITFFQPRFVHHRTCPMHGLQRSLSI